MSSADTQAPGEANGSAAMIAFSPQRVSMVLVPPREAGRIVVVAGDDEHVRSGPADTHQEPVHELLGLGRRVAALEDIPGVKDKVDGVLFDEGREMVEHGLELVEALDALPSPADVPIAGMDDLHGRESITRASLSAVFLLKAYPRQVKVAGQETRLIRRR
jgi:hypothetical protein